MSIAHEIASQARERYVVLGQRIFAVRRVNSDDLRHVGWAALEGTASVREAQKRMAAEVRELRDRLNGTPAEQIAAERAKVGARLEQMAVEKLELLEGRPEGRNAFLERCTAYVCAAVCGAGRLLQRYSGEALVLNDGVDPDQIAEPLPDAGDGRIRYLEPVRFVRLEADEDLDAGRIWVHRLTEDDRRSLGLQCIALQSVASEVAPFRRAAGAARDVSPAGDDVQGAPAPAPAARPVGGGVQRRGTRGRARGGERADAQGNDGHVVGEPLTR